MLCYTSSMHILHYLELSYPSTPHPLRLIITLTSSHINIPTAATTRGKLAANERQPAYVLSPEPAVQVYLDHSEAAYFSDM